MNIPTRVGAYDILGEIGAGGMGTVLRARHRELGRDVAIKFAHDDAVRSVRLLKRLKREGQLAARLRHPNIVTVFEVVR